MMANKTSSDVSASDQVSDLTEQTKPSLKILPRSRIYNGNMVAVIDIEVRTGLKWNLFNSLDGY